MEQTKEFAETIKKYIKRMDFNYGYAKKNLIRYIDDKIEELNEKSKQKKGWGKSY